MGGAEALAYEFARRLDQERFSSCLCITRRPAPERETRAARELDELQRGGVSVLRLDRDSTRSLAPWLRLYAFLRRERIDIVHAHMPRASVPGTLIGRAAGVPVVISHEHGSSLERGKRVRRILDRQIVARGSDVILAVSEWDRANLIRHEGIPPGKVAVFRHGIDAARCEQRAVVELRRELGAESAPLIGAVGNLLPVKGHADLLMAVRALADRGLPVQCVIAGTGPEHARLTALIGELGLAGRVRLLGYRSDVPALLRALDVVAVPSHSEGAPLAVIEAMAAGRPIVASNVAGIPELIADEIHGLLVPPREPSAIATAIERLLDDPELAARLGEAAHRRQRCELDLNVSVRALEALYLDLHARSGSRGVRPGRRGESRSPQTPAGGTTTPPASEAAGGRAGR
jgi:glycosyltransferase involved in cell wall biosynthesis